MEHLDLPNETEWNRRREWFQELILKHSDIATTTLTGEQATALIFEVQCCFCAGAWAAVTILSVSVIEANIDETTPRERRERNLQQKLKTRGLKPMLERLRLRRNALVHLPRDGNPAITVDHQYDDRDSLELEARDAVRLMFEAFDKPAARFDA